MLKFQLEITSSSYFELNPLNAKIFHRKIWREKCVRYRKFQTGKKISQLNNIYRQQLSSLLPTQSVSSLVNICRFRRRKISTQQKAKVPTTTKTTQKSSCLSICTESECYVQFLTCETSGQRKKIDYYMGHVKCLYFFFVRFFSSFTPIVHNFACK